MKFAHHFIRSACVAAAVLFFILGGTARAGKITALYAFGGATPAVSFLGNASNGVIYAVTDAAAKSSPANTSPLNVVLAGSGTASYQNGQGLVVGKRYTIKATPARGYIVSNWTGSGPTNFSWYANDLPFLMQSNLTLTATFIPNFYLTNAGVYHGLIGPTNGPRDQATSGAITVTISESEAGSGIVDLNGKSTAVSGMFNGSGSALVSSDILSVATPIFVELNLDITNQTLTGSVLNGYIRYPVVAVRAGFGGAAKATGYEGQYTFAIPGGTDPTVGPAGTSVGVVKVSSSGAVTLAGSLADGTAIAQASAISANGMWPIYVNLYKGKGSLWGWAQISSGTLTDVSNLSWINGGNSAAKALYSSGFTNNAATLTGGLFTSSAVLPASATVTLTGGGLASPLTNAVTISAGAVTVANKAADTDKLVLTINKTTGAVSGSFVNPSASSKPVPLTGVVIAGSTNIQGYFPGGGVSGTLLVQ